MGIAESFGVLNLRETPFFTNTAVGFGDWEQIASSWKVPMLAELVLQSGAAVSVIIEVVMAVFRNAVRELGTVGVVAILDAVKVIVEKILALSLYAGRNLGAIRIGTIEKPIAVFV